MNKRKLILIFLIIIIFSSYLYESYFKNEKLDCDKINSYVLCIETEVAVKTDDWSRIIYHHKFPNLVVQNDELYIKSIKVFNKFGNTTKETPYTINFVPLDKKSYEKTPYISQNIGEFNIKIPSLKKGDIFVVQSIAPSVYKIYKNDEKNVTTTGHWNIPMYTYGNWKIEQSQIGGTPTGETSLNWVINGRLNWGGTFDVISTSEFYNIRNDFFILILTITTIILAIYSIRRQYKDSRRVIKSEEIRFLKVQIGLLNSLLTELEIISADADKIKIVTKSYETKGNLEWFLECLDNNQIPLHDMWQIESSKYLSGLTYEITNAKLKNIKKILALINQRISLINFYRIELISEADKIYKSKEWTPQKPIDDTKFKILSKNTAKTIKELMEVIKDSKILVKEYIDRINEETNKISKNYV